MHRILGVLRLALVLLPDGVKVIVAAIVQADFVARSESRSFTTRRRVPFNELIAGIGEEVALLNSDDSIVSCGFGNIIHSRAIRLVGDNGPDGRTAIDRRERHVGCGHLQLVAGIIVLIAIDPVEEELAFGSSIGCAKGLNIRKTVLGIELRILHGAFAVCQIIGNCKPLRTGVVRIEFNVLIDLRVEVEGLIGIIALCARAHAPAAPDIAIGNFRLQRFQILFRNRLAILNFYFFRAINAGHGEIHRRIVGRQIPLRIHRNIARRHRSLQRCSFGAGFIQIPTAEFVFDALGRQRGSLRHICGSVINVRLILFRYLVNTYTIAQEVDLIGVAAIIEARIIITPFITRRSTSTFSTFFIYQELVGKSRNRILVFVRYFKA